LMGTSNSFLFGLYIGSGLLWLGLTIAGTNQFMNLGAVPTGQVVTYRATFDPVSGNAIGYYSLDNGATWVTLTTVVRVGAVSVFGGNLFLGQILFAVGGSCRIYTAELITAGTRTFYFNSAVDITSGGQTAGTTSFGHTFTINRATAGRKTVAVTRPVWLFGTDDYMTVPDNALINFNATDSFTVLAVVRGWNTSTLNGRVVAKGTPSSARWGLVFNSPLQTISMLNDGVNGGNSSTAAHPAGTAVVMAMSLDRVPNINTTYTSGQTAGTSATGAVGTVTNTEPLGIGANGAGNTFQDFELLAVAVFRRALSATEIASINTYYGTA